MKNGYARIEQNCRWKIFYVIYSRVLNVLKRINTFVLPWWLFCLFVCLFHPKAVRLPDTDCICRINVRSAVLGIRRVLPRMRQKNKFYTAISLYKGSEWAHSSDRKGLGVRKLRQVEC